MSNDIDINGLRNSIRRRVREMHNDVDGIDFMLIGSIAQGLGNSRSDIDVLAVDFSGQQYGIPKRQLTHIRDQRCEIFFASPEDLQALHDRHAVDLTGGEDDFDLFLRIPFGVNLSQSERLTVALRPFDRELVLAAYSRHIDRNISTLASRMLMMTRMDLGRFASGVARELAECILQWRIAQEKDHLPARVKHLPAQVGMLRAAGKAADSAFDRLIALCDVHLAEDPNGYISRVTDELAALYPTSDEPALVGTSHITMNEDVEAVEFIGTGALVSGGGKRVYVVPEDRRQLLGSVVAGQVMPEPENDAEAEWQAALLCNGIAHIDTNGEKWRIPNTEGCNAQTLPHVTFHDIRLGDRVGRPPWPSGLSKDQVCDCLQGLRMAGIFYANAKEDAVGAIKDQNWRLAGWAMKEMAAQLAAMGISHRGVGVSLQDWGYERLDYIAGQHPDLRVWSGMLRSVGRMKVHDLASARQMFAIIEEHVPILPKDVFDSFSRSMEDGVAHQFAIVEMGLKLAELAAGCGPNYWWSRRPGHAVQSAITAEPDHPFHKMQQRANVNWRRADDVAAELSLLASR